ncbi:MAG: hypothetical protein RLZZ592_2014 [Pseudomonadota bacterium]|jgi:ribosome-associated translation inhibitor RaiA|nr:hypothetical protein [Pseudomonadota bacterium]
MDVLFESRHAEARSLRDQVIRRLRFSTRRLGALVPQARILLEDANGPRGGIDKQCRIELRGPRLGHLTVQAEADTWQRAFEQALARISRALASHWQRLRELPRSARRRLPASSDPGE